MAARNGLRERGPKGGRGERVVGRGRGGEEGPGRRRRRRAHSTATSAVMRAGRGLSRGEERRWVGKAVVRKGEERETLPGLADRVSPNEREQGARQHS
jgi:hypothetical protein